MEPRGQDDHKQKNQPPSHQLKRRAGNLMHQTVAAPGRATKPRRTVEKDLSLRTLSVLPPALNRGWETLDPNQLLNQKERRKDSKKEPIPVL